MSMNADDLSTALETAIRDELIAASRAERLLASRPEERKFDFLRDESGEELSPALEQLAGAIARAIGPALVTHIRSHAVVDVPLDAGIPGGPPGAATTPTLANKGVGADRILHGTIR